MGDNSGVNSQFVSRYVVGFPEPKARHEGTKQFGVSVQFRISQLFCVSK
jgi:hypothetical protein